MVESSWILFILSATTCISLSLASPGQLDSDLPFGFWFGGHGTSRREDSMVKPARDTMHHMQRMGRSATDANDPPLGENLQDLAQWLVANMRKGKQATTRPAKRRAPQPGGISFLKIGKRAPEMAERLAQLENGDYVEYEEELADPMFRLHKAWPNPYIYY